MKNATAQKSEVQVRRTKAAQAPQQPVVRQVTKKDEKKLNNIEFARCM